MLHAVTAKKWWYSFLIGALAVLILSAFFVVAPPAQVQFGVGITSSLRPPSNSPRIPLDTPTSTSTSTPDPCAPEWSVVPSPNVGTGDNFLNGVAAVSANDVWAVGYYVSDQGRRVPVTLVEHWNGSAWSVVPSPNVGTHQNTLLGVAAVSANDVWAVGGYGGTLVEHWDGSAWSVEPSPHGGSLYGVAVVSANDVWAVGYYDSTGTGLYQTLTEHWNGSAWSVVPSPNVGTSDNHLQGVAVVSANDVWAVGYYDIQTLVEHWDGSA